MLHVINYAAEMSALANLPLPDVIAGLMERLPDEWAKGYAAMPGAGSDLVSIVQHGYIYLFDINAERVVVAFGQSTPTSTARDSSRMQGFLKKMSDRFNGRGDKGHIMSHAQGGGMDINLFPQRPDVNRGRSKDGKIYRELERYCSMNPTAFCFSRLLYSDATWVPNEIEYGVLYHAKQFRVERVSNAAS